MTSGIHFVCYDSTFGSISQVAGQTQLRTGNYRPDISETFLALLLVAQETPVVFADVSTQPFPRLTMAAFTTNPDRDSQIFFIQLGFDGPMSFSCLCFHGCNGKPSVTRETSFIVVRNHSGRHRIANSLTCLTQQRRIGLSMFVILAPDSYFITTNPAVIGHDSELIPEIIFRKSICVAAIAVFQAQKIMGGWLAFLNRRRRIVGCLPLSLNAQ
jgi:hypothetical protein